MVKILKHQTIYQSSRFHAAFPSVAKFSDGKLLLAFRRARDGLWLIPEEKRSRLNPFSRMDHIDSRSHIVLMELSDDGQNQIGEIDILPCDPEAADQDPSLLIMPNDKVFLAAFSWYPLPSDAAEILSARKSPGDSGYLGCRYIFWGSHVSYRGRKQGSWKKHHEYLLPDSGYGHALTSNNSKRLVPATRGQGIYFKGKIFFATYGSASEGCALFSLNNTENNWDLIGIIAKDKNHKITFQEPAICNDGSGGIVCFMRTANANDRLATSHSDDGIVWSEPVLHELVGHPFHPLELKDGRVLLTYGFRHEPYGIRARLLSNPMQNPDESNEIIIRDDGLCADIGYPWAVEMETGNVFVCYYWTNPDGLRSIASTILTIN